MVGQAVTYAYMCFTNLLGPPISLSLLKPHWATTAPIFPQAAEIPWAVERYRVGKTSPGTMNTVTFGPKFCMKLARQ